MPGTNFESDADGYDPQDRAETFDEANLTGDGDSGEVRSFAEADDRTAFEDLPDVEDVTQAEGDRDADEAVALEADEFGPETVTDADLEEDDELNYRAATAEREDDIDGLGAEDGFDEDAMDLASSIEGLDEEVADAGLVSGGEDDVSNFQARNLSDEDLQRMGYSENRKGVTLAKPDG